MQKKKYFESTCKCGYFFICVLFFIICTHLYGNLLWAAFNSAITYIFAMSNDIIYNVDLHCWSAEQMAGNLTDCFTEWIPAAWRLSSTTLSEYAQLITRYQKDLLQLDDTLCLPRPFALQSSARVVCTCSVISANQMTESRGKRISFFICP